jgi:Ca2+/Na+ antiporter
MFQRYMVLGTLTALVISIGAVSIQVTSVYAQEQKFTAALSGSQEVPPNTSTAKGWAWFKPMGDTVGYKVNGTGINKVTMAHIHNAKAGENGDPIAMLQIVKSGGPTLAQGNITASDLMGSLTGKSISDLVTKMQSGETYVNVHTDANPNGEIRGQIEMANATTMSNSTMSAK